MYGCTVYILISSISALTKYLSYVIKHAPICTRMKQRVLIALLAPCRIKPILTGSTFI